MIPLIMNRNWTNTIGQTNHATTRLVLVIVLIVVGILLNAGGI